MERDDLIGGLLALAGLWVVVIGMCYGTYRYGKFAERRALYSVLAGSIEATYTDAFKEGLAAGRVDGWVAGMKECDQEPLPVGRY